MKRRSLTRAEREAMFAEQGGACANCGTGFPLAELEAEHYTPVFMGNDGKPDALWCGPCHRDKTAADQGRIGKVKRQLGKTRSQWAGTNKHKGRLKGRGFDKTLRKRMDGTVEQRDARG